MPSTHTNYFPIRGHPVIYRGNGTGRDTYIQNDSGGLIKAQNSNKHKFDTGTFPGRSNSAPRCTAPRLDGKTIYYRTDGTGRDSYINANSGGFSRAYGGANFMQNLRTYQKITRPPTRTASRPTSSYGSPNSTGMQIQGSNLLGTAKPMTNDQRIENMKKQMINGLVSRLSIPKRSDSPFKNSQHPEYQRERVRCQSATSRGNQIKNNSIQDFRLPVEEKAETVPSARRESFDIRKTTDLNRSLNMANIMERKASVDSSKSNLILTSEAKRLQAALANKLQRPQSCMRSRQGTIRL